MKIKTIAMLLTLVLVCGLFFGCSGTTSEQTASPSSAPSGSASAAPTEEPAAEPQDGDYDADAGAYKLPLTEETVEFTCWYPMDARQAEVYTNLDEHYVYAELTRRTNVKMVMTHPPLNGASENFNLLVSGDDLPDTLFSSKSYYAKGPDHAIEYGVYTRLNEAIAEYMPVYSALISADPEVMKLLVTDSGNMCSVNQIYNVEPYQWGGYWMRQDFLDEVGMEKPKTFDQWHDVLTAFKDQLGVKSPLMLASLGYDAFGTNFGLAGFEVGQDYYQVDGEVKYGPLQPGYREYLEVMNQWFTEKLIDQDFTSGDTTLYASSTQKCLKDETGVMFTFPSNCGDVLQKNGSAANENFYLTGVLPPLRDESQTLHFRIYQTVVGSDFAITPNGEDRVEQILKFLDYQYTPEGSELCNYGELGVSYTYVDGVPTFTDLILNNPDGRPFSNALYSWTIMNHPCYTYTRRTTVTYSEEAFDTLDVWMAQDYDYMIPTAVTPTAEESSSFAAINTDISTYISEMAAKFITGVESFDNYDAFIAQINNMRIDEAVAIKQAALDRFNAR